MRTSGLFITFEGGEGAGKSTQIRLLADALTTAGQNVVITRAPGGTDMGQKIRQILLGTEGEPPAQRVEALLFLADIAHLADTVIRPAVEQGAVVLCDRYLDSTIAYQGGGRGLDPAAITSAGNWGTGGLIPDLTLLLDVDPSTGLGRKSADEWNRMEAAGTLFHDRVRTHLQNAAHREPDRFIMIDANRPAEAVHRDVLAATIRAVGGS